MREAPKVQGALALGIDASTTAVKAVVFDEHGQTRAEGRSPLSLSNPSPDAWEQDANQYRTALEGAIRGAVSALGSEVSQIVALAVAHQRETFIASDASGEPLCPAIVWMDSRARGEVQQVLGEISPEEIHRLSGKPACVTPSLYKIRHLIGGGVPAAASALAGIRRIDDVGGYLLARITGRRVTSTASADPLGLVDMQTQAWSPRLVELARIDQTFLPALAPPASELGPIDPAFADRVGLPRAVRAVAGAGDGQAACLGVGLADPGSAYLNLGTAIVGGVLSPTYSVDRAYRTLFAATAGEFLLETDLKGGTFTLDYLVDRLLGRHLELSQSDARKSTLSELEEEAGGLSPGSAGLVLVPYLLGVMNPYWDDDASGLLLGLAGHHRPAHLYRAILEGLAFETRSHLEAVERATSPIRTILVTGGGSGSDLFCQIVADTLGKQVIRSGSTEATALGAAMLAFAGVGVFSDAKAAARSMSRGGRSFQPGASSAVYQRLYREVYAGLYDLVSERMRKLRELSQSTL